MNQDSIRLLIEATKLAQKADDISAYMMWIISGFLFIAVAVVAYQAYYQEDLIKKRTAEIENKNQQLEVVGFTYVHDFSGAVSDLAFVFDILPSADTASERDELLELGAMAAKRQESLLEGAVQWSKAISANSEIELTKEDITEFMAKRLPKGVQVLPLGVVECNKNLFLSVLQNLTLNALKHNDKENKIVKVYREGKCIVVEDNGIGFPLDQVDKLFKPFQKGSNSIGQGLGLSIVLAILQKHAFELEIQSEIGKGSKFIINL